MHTMYIKEYDKVDIIYFYSRSKCKKKEKINIYIYSMYNVLNTVIYSKALKNSLSASKHSRLHLYK